jgi:hypothetical protein
LRYYDKEAKQQVKVPDGFTFILLDETACVRGWNDPAESGMYSNEVRDTRSDAIVVKLFKGGGIVASGFYADIREKIMAAGGHFTANCYIAFKDGNTLSIGGLQFKGAALGAWMEFRKANRGEIYKQAITIKGYKEGKKGKVVFRTPCFFLKQISEDTENTAIALDKTLQEYLAGYFQRTKTAAASQPPEPVKEEAAVPRHERSDNDGPGLDDEAAGAAAAASAHDDVPF